MRSTAEPTTSIPKQDRCGDLPHRPRVLLGKMGLDGHDRGVKLIARVMRDSGIHVVYSGLWQTPRSLAIGARDEDVDCVAASMMSNSHLVLVPRLLSELKAVGRGDIPVNVGGIIPQSDVQALLDAGVARVYHTGTGMEDIVESVRASVKPYVPRTSGPAEAILARQISLAQAGALPASAARRRPARVIGLIGSNATTAIRWPRRTASLAIAATSVLLPAPGEPVMPTTRAGRLSGVPAGSLPACASEMSRASDASRTAPAARGAYGRTEARTLSTISSIPVPVW